ncbi:MAG: hypothetical protein GY786_21240 [Proteobacteria bacterium]|nr:hypothetical protein [Pseudomonadota bacterium]
MNLVVTIIAILMVADSAFTLGNLTKVESILATAFPNLDIRKLALIEGIAGLIILGIKITTKTLS